MVFNKQPNMTRLLSVICAVIAVFSGTSSVNAEASSESSNTIHMAAILPLTGESASWGQAIKNGMMMAYEKLPSEVRDKLEIIYEDDMSSPKMSISALRKLLASGRIDIVINESSATSKALAPILEAKRIPLLAVASDPDVVLGKRYAFNFWVTPEQEAKALIPEMQRLGYKRIARITTTHPGTFALREAIDARLPKDVTLVLDQDYPADLKDFRDFITKLRARQRDLDAVMAILVPGQLGIFSRQLRQMGVSLPLFGGETFEDIAELTLSQGALLGAWYVTADDGKGAFLSEYHKRFPGASSGCAANGYDAVLLMARAVELGTKPDAIQGFLATLRDFSGALGTYSSTGDQRFDLPARVKVVTQP